METESLGKGDQSGRARFGVFELDVESGELRKLGRRVRLQPQPSKVLATLVARPGQIVTREELKHQIWNGTTFVDFEQGLNFCVRQIRLALDDNAEAPQYIETLPRVGYRFVANVTSVPLQRNEWQGSTNADSRKGFSKRPTLGWRWLGVAASLLILLSAIAIWRLPRKSAESLLPPVEVVPLVSLKGQQGWPAFSPDGNQVTFANEGQENAGIYTMLVGGDKLLRLTANPDDCCPVWSPDGRQIAFTRHFKQQISFYLVSAIGGTEQRLYTGPASLRLRCGRLDWSPDGKVLAFSEPIEGGIYSRIALLSLTDLTVRALTSPPKQGYDCEPAFSPDGLSMAFARGSSGGNRRDLFVLPVTGGEPKQLTFENSGATPVWTQDGKEIVFSSDRGGLLSLWRISATGGVPRPATGIGPMAFRPSIARKNNLLAYQYYAANDSIFRINLTNEGHALSPPVSLISSRGTNFRPSFSPDGKKVAFESDRLGYSDIWYCDSDGSNCAQLTSLHGTAGTARWSPNGHYIVFEFQSGNHYGIYMIEAPGGRPHLVPTFPEADNGAPNWSRDGQWIYFYSNHEKGPFQLWKVPFKGGPPVQVTKNGGVYGIESEDGQSLYYSKLEQPGIWKMPLNGGQETIVLEQPEGHHWYSWTLAPGGIYFLNLSYVPNGRIEFFDFASGQIRPIFAFDRPEVHGGLALSPDGTSLIYTQHESEDSYIMLAKNFR
jgi:Tol biopolymer transport system component/DNA-binding winged helix-turn-helix (wHTH) protein